MPSRYWPDRPVVTAKTSQAAKKTIVILIMILIAAASITGGFLFRSLVTDLAVSAAQDDVVSEVNEIVKEIMTRDGFDAGRLVNLEKDVSGGITAISTNVAAVNTLAAEILEQAVARTEQEYIRVGVPLGNMFGITLLSGKGPDIAVDVIMLSSSVAGFRSELTSAGINQTRHQIVLELSVQISLLMPWRTISTFVDTEVLVSETVIVGDVPNSYLNLGE